MIVTLGACGSSDGGDTQDGDPIVIGVSLPLTGDFSEPGKGVQQGYEAWQKIINEKGGLLGRQVELKILDDQSNADRVVADYEQLIGKDEVDLVFGPFSTRLVVPSARVAEEYDMLFVEPAGAAKEVFEQGFKNLFYAAPAVANDHYNHLAEKILAMPADQRPKTAAYAAMDDPFAQGTAYGLKEKLEAGGVKTVVNEVYPPNTTDFSGIAAKIADSKADVLVGGSQYQDGVNLIVALQQLGYQPELAAFSTAPTNPEFASAIGNKTAGVLSPTGYSQDAPYESNKEFVEKYTAQFGKAPEEDQANGYTTGQVVAAAVTAVGCAEQGECQQKLVDWVRANTVDTVVGPLSWDETGKPKGAHMIQQWIDGDIKIVLPEDVKEAEFLYPKPAW
ncbi:putative branched-chain amino acid ABC transporter substrate-binding protein [Actinoplanes missouriensis 431]|uniref:Putative branched-chain amino acid ABC transporter substrate-binding protein n=1 Tax=Actinoplanes missouriensis (strain ATCC 14538 / DSM 43046 / CBS 188.64 / JCM 3121 / NBRC 102363 / NCIMB 12654 / NRRL B-3342 / UNCC 431) TaxID=512565 RepID=I0HEV8_ACTM4|nr:amino acid ABC transporter substrate-binding protein [Actinoplanes missouriensis]BAL91545.1 putative branched-chain amino acid ABC transporter substrate-binding protein [Actinoplanes missouriensis 431]